MNIPAFNICLSAFRRAGTVKILRMAAVVLLCHVIVYSGAGCARWQQQEPQVVPMTFRPSPPPPVLQPEPLPAPPAPEETVVATIPAIWPVEHPERRISSRFASSRRGGRRHKGIDIEAPKDTPIYATASGVVTFAGWQGAYGKIIVINHDNEYDTTYAHVGAFLVDEGDFVQLGQEIGLVGATGNATAFHVHYEVLSNGKHVNPEQWLP